MCIKPLRDFTARWVTSNHTAEKEMVWAFQEPDSGAALRNSAYCSRFIRFCSKKIHTVIMVMNFSAHQRRKEQFSTYLLRQLKTCMRRKLFRFRGVCRSCPDQSISCSTDLLQAVDFHIHTLNMCPNPLSSPGLPVRVAYIQHWCSLGA